MKTDIGISLEHHFSSLQDPRIDRTKQHKLLDIMVIAICAVIAGADSWYDIEAFGEAKEGWFRQFLELANGIPSHDTFGRLFARLDPEQFETCFRHWVAANREVIAGEIVAIDGKVLRGSQDKWTGKGAIDIVSAWASANHLILGQVKVEDKSNEITAIPNLLIALQITGCIVTIDAMGCQTDIAEQIIDQDADYVLALKGNQGQLHEDVRLLFDDLEESDYKAYDYDHTKTTEKGHGRIEVRECWSISTPVLLHNLRGAARWKSLKSVVRIRSQRRVGEKQTTENRYYIASIDKAGPILAATRFHWGIENKVHWQLDVAFNEDRCRSRKDNSAENFSTLRRLALNLLRQEKTCKRSIKGKRLVAGWKNDYLLKVLSGLTVVNRN